MSPTDLAKTSSHSDAFLLLPSQGAKTMLKEEKTSFETDLKDGPKTSRPQATIWSWKQEIFSCAAANCLLGFLYVYFYFKNVIKTALAIPLCEGIAQLKWVFFRRRDLQFVEIAHFDDASRGEMLSMSNLARHFFHDRRVMCLALTGSFIVSLSFIVGPFTQQAIQLVPILAENTTALASVPICATNYTDHELKLDSEGISMNQHQVSFSTKSAMILGLMQSQTEKDLQPTCPSGNCTFPAYQSLEFCSECADITEHMEKLLTDPPQHPSSWPYSLYSYRLPNNLTLSANPAVPVNTTANREDPFYPAFTKIRGVVLDFTAIEYHEESKNASATECLVFYCVKSYKSAAYEKTSDSPSMLSEESSAVFYETEECHLVTNSSLTLIPESCYAEGQLFERNHSLSGGPSNVSSTCIYTIPFYSAYYVHADLSNMVQDKYILRMLHNNIKAAFTSLALLLTNHIRSDKKICRGSVNGKAYSSIMVVAVDRRFFMPITFHVIATSLFLLVVIWSSRHYHVWKTSSLPLLFAAMNDGPQTAHLQPGLNMHEMKKASKKMKVRLDVSEGIRLSKVGESEDS